MIYNKKIQNYVPIRVESVVQHMNDKECLTKYTVKDGKIPVGYINLIDKENGVFVSFIKNQQENLYSGFGKIADQIEVEHCLKRGLKKFEIISKAALNSHALHYLRGKRFYSTEIEKTIEDIIKNRKKGERFDTRHLGNVDMYMPENLIKKYIALIKKFPLLK